MLADLRGGDNVALRLDRATAYQRLPMRQAGWHRERRRI